MTAAACRQPLSAQTARPSTYLTVPEFAEASALERDLAALCTEGLLESFLDEHGVTRYRPRVALEQAA
jgi:hypothetical protein